MGSWNTSITGNDTAQDLRSEYTVAFFHYDVAEALQKIDAFVRTEGFDESDEEEWCSYYYSLADFMWKKGILIDEVRDKAIGMIDSGFGLGLWAEAGEKVLASRKKKLEEFRTKLLSPQPSKKKIKPNVHLETIFEPGDIVAVKLQTAGKPYTENDERPMTDDEFHAFDGKYILMQLIECRASWSSAIVPEVKDYWAYFRLFDGIYDEIPENLDFVSLSDANMLSGQKITGIFWCESSMYYFKRRSYRVIDNRRSLIEGIDSRKNCSIFWGINKPWYNCDSALVAAMGKQIQCGIYSGNTERINFICKKANRYGRFDYRLSKEENELRFQAEEQQISIHIKNAMSEGGKLLSISFGKEMGVALIKGDCIIGVYIEGMYQQNGFGTKLLAYAFDCIDEGYIDIPKGHTVLLHICDKLGLQEIPAADADYIRRKK